MADDIEAELRTMLSEPTAETVRRKMRDHEVRMEFVSRSLAAQIKPVWAALAEKLLSGQDQNRKNEDERPDAVG